MTPDSMPGCSSTPGSACDNGPSYAAVVQGYPTTAFQSASQLSSYDYDTSRPASGGTAGLPIGNEGVYSSTTDDDRAYFEFQLSALNSNMYISTSNLYENLIWSSDWGCNDTWPAELWWTDGIGTGTDWNSQPGRIQSADIGFDKAIPAGYNPSSACSRNTGVSPPTPLPQTFSFNVYAPVSASASAGHLAVGIYGDEGVSGNPSGNMTGDCAGGVASINGLTGPGYNCGSSVISTDPEIITSYDLSPPAANDYSITGPTAYDKPGTSDNGCNNDYPYLASTSATLNAQVYPDPSMVTSTTKEQVAGVFSTTGYNGNATTGGNGEYPQNASGGVAPATPASSTSGAPVNAPVKNLVNGDLYWYGVASETDGIPWGQNGSNVGKLQSAMTACAFAVDTTAPATPRVLSVVPNYDSTAKDISSVTLTVMGEEKAPTGCGFSPCYDSGIYQYDYSSNGTTVTGTAPAIGYDSTGQSQTGVYTNGYPSATGTTGAPIVNGTIDSQPYCIDDLHGGTTAGTVVDIDECNGTGPQKWNYNWSTGYLQAGSMCAEATGDATAAGTPIELQTCANGTYAGEWWNLGTNGSLVNANSGLCLNAPSTAHETQLTLATCTGSAGQDWSNTYATITVPATTWGVNTIYLKAETAAGVSSANYETYSYYVPFSGTATLGDVTGDGYPDLMATGSDGNLYACTGTSSATGFSNGCSTIVGTPATSPGATTSSPVGWNNFTITHRGSDTGVITDNLYAYNPAQGPGTPPLGLLSEYTDSDNTAGIYYHFSMTTNGQPSLHSADTTSTTTTAITPENGTDNTAITMPALPAGISLAHGSSSCPSIASAGDGNGGYFHPALYALCTINGTQKILDIIININPATEANDLNQGTPAQLTLTLPSGVTLTPIS